MPAVRASRGNSSKRRGRPSASRRAAGSSRSARCAPCSAACSRRSRPNPPTSLYPACPQVAPPEPEPEPDPNPPTPTLTRTRPDPTRPDPTLTLTLTLTLTGGARRRARRAQLGARAVALLGVMVRRVEGHVAHGLPSARRSASRPSLSAGVTSTTAPLFCTGGATRPRRRSRTRDRRALQVPRLARWHGGHGRRVRTHPAPIPPPSHPSPTRDAHEACACATCMCMCMCLHCCAMCMPQACACACPRVCTCTRWEVTRETRQSGNSQGTTDLYYHAARRALRRAALPFACRGRASLRPQP